MGLLDTFGKFIFNLKDRDTYNFTRYMGSFNSKYQSREEILRSYESNVDAYSVIKKIIDVTKSVPWIVEVKNKGVWTEITDTTIHELMATPNITKGYTWNDIEEQILLYLLCTGNSYVYTDSQIGKSLIEEIDILPTSNVTIEGCNEDFFLPEYKYRFNIGRTNRTIEREQVAHIKFFNPVYQSISDGLYGLSPIQVAARVIQVGNDRWDADANLLQNRGAVGLITDKSNRPMTPDEAKAVNDSFNNSIGGKNSYGKIHVTNKDLSYIQLAMSPVDLQLLEKGVVNLRAICNVFGLDSSLFNDPENKTYSNRVEAEKSMYTNAIMPISDKVGEHLTRKICPNHFPMKEVRMRQDFSNIEVLQENFKEKADVYALLKNSGIVSANTAAEALKQPISTDANADALIISSGNSLLSSLRDASEGTSMSNGDLGKLPLALQQLALARERANTAGDVELSNTISIAMDKLTAQIIAAV